MSTPEPHRTDLAVRLAANSLAQAVGSGLAAFVAFFTFVAITRGLGPEAYGHLTAATVFLFIPAVLAEAGLSAAVLRQISAAPNETEHAMRASLPIRTAISLVAIAGAVAVGLAMPFPAETKVAIAIFSVGSFFTLMTVNVQPVLQAQLKLHWLVAATLTGRLVTLALTLSALAVGLGFRTVVAAQAAGLAVTFFFTIGVVGRLVSLRPLYDAAYWRRLVAGSLAIGTALALSQVYFRVDALLVALLRSAVEVGLYGAAFKFIELSELVVVAIGMSVLPTLSRFVAVGDPRAFRLVQRSFDVMVAAAAPLAVAMVVFASPIVVATAGPEFEAASGALRLLGPYVVFSFVNGLLVRILIASRRDRTLLGIVTSLLGTNVALNLLFLPLYGFRAAAAISVASEALALVPVSLAVRRLGLLPRVGYLPTVFAAAAAMALVGVAVPGGAFVAASAGFAAYMAVVLTLPGTVRDVFFGRLVPAARRYVVRSRA